MKQKITPQDAPKIAIALFVLLAIGGVGWMRMQGAAASQEQDRAALQMKRESGQAVAVGDENLSGSNADEAQTRREEASPDFHD